MKHIPSIILSAFLLLLNLTACDSGPRVIESEPTAEGSKQDASSPTIPSLQEATNSAGSSNEQHRVVVDEVLNTERYSYLLVSEGDESYWIAITKQEVEAGDVYYYRGGLMKKNFFSQEFNRVFETIYLVSNIWKEPSSSEAVLDEAFAQMAGGNSADLEVGEITPASGAISLADLFSNKAQYENQLVKVTGKCVKVNPMIMNRNWVHIQDGSGDDLDLTITTTENIPLGAVVTVEGTISLNKDFGAGYRYDIIMESAVVQ